MRINLNHAEFWPLAIKFWLALSISIFVFYDRLRSFTSENNRLEIAWSFNDVGIIYLCVLLVSICILFGRFILKSIKLNEFFQDRIFVALAIVVIGPALSSVLLNDIVLKIVGHPQTPFDFLQISEQNYYAYFFSNLFRIFNILIFIIGLTIGAKWMKKILVGLVLILSPFFVVYPLGAIAYQPIPTKTGSLNSILTKSTPGKNAIFFFLFDGWDYKNTFSLTPDINKFPGLKELSLSSEFYTEAITPSTLTAKSIPAILGKDQGSIFASAKTQGWGSAIVAGYFPYQKMYGQITDYCHRVVWFKENIPLLSRIEFESKIAGQSILLFWIPKLGERFKLRNDVYYHRQQDNMTHQYVLDMIQEGTSKNIYYFHYPVPHWPFFIVPDLVEQGVPSKEQHILGYQDNLRVMDNHISEIIQMVKKTGQWESSMLIFTGDHGWRFDPVRPRKLIENRHVPLYIKWPNQKDPKIINERFHTEDLKIKIIKTLKESRHTG